MLQIMQIFTIILVAIGMVPAVAHALEHPGKMRLDRDHYLSVQAIYYPGFTIIGGAGEVVGMLATIVLLLMTPRETTAFLWTLVAVAGMLGMQIIYWTLIHPVNQYWLKNANATLGNLGSGFFAFASGPGQSGQVDWTYLRDRWEYSHIARAGLAFLSFISLLFAIVVTR